MNGSPGLVRAADYRRIRRRNERHIRGNPVEAARRRFGKAAPPVPPGGEPESSEHRDSVVRGEP